MSEIITVGLDLAKNVMEWMPPPRRHRDVPSW